MFILPKHGFSELSQFWLQISYYEIAARDYQLGVRVKRVRLLSLHDEACTLAWMNESWSSHFLVELIDRKIFAAQLFRNPVINHNNVIVPLFS